MTHPDFNEAAWIGRWPPPWNMWQRRRDRLTYPLSTELGGYGSIEERQSTLRRAYFDLAARAKHDPTASIQFKDSYLQVNANPVEAMAILREHPLIEPELKVSGRDELVGFRVLGVTFGETFKGLVARLAKLSIKD